MSSIISISMHLLYGWMSCLILIVWASPSCEDRKESIPSVISEIYILLSTLQYRLARLWESWSCQCLQAHYYDVPSVMPDCHARGPIPILCGLPNQADMWDGKGCSTRRGSQYLISLDKILFFIVQQDEVCQKKFIKYNSFFPNLLSELPQIILGC